jgi:hypothetical protein
VSGGPLLFYSPAFGINDQGVIVGTYGPGKGPAEHGFVLRRSIITTLTAPGSAGVIHALGINNASEVVGEYADARGPPAWLLVA